MVALKASSSRLVLFFYLLLSSTFNIGAALPISPTLTTTSLQPRDALEITNVIIGLVSLVEQGIMDLIKIGQLVAEEHAAEAQFTQDFVKNLRAKYPKKNVIIYHDQKSKYNLVNNAHQHVELGLDFFSTTKGYEIDVFDSGTFTLAGDEGDLNWYFGGNYVRNGKSVTFHAIP